MWMTHLGDWAGLTNGTVLFRPSLRPYRYGQNYLSSSLSPHFLLLPFLQTKGATSFLHIFLLFLLSLGLCLVKNESNTTGDDLKKVSNSPTEKGPRMRRPHSQPATAKSAMNI